MANVMLIVLFRLIPMSWAAPISSETALMAFPALVLLTTNVRRIMISTETKMVTMAV